jgi:hypothetical protein
MDWKMRCYDELPRSVFESPEPVAMSGGMMKQESGHE